MAYQIIETTDHQYIGVVIDSPKVGDVIALGDFNVEVVYALTEGDLLVLHNPNYVIYLKAV